MFIIYSNADNKEFKCIPKKSDLLYKKDCNGEIIYTINISPKQLFTVCINKSKTKYCVSKDLFSIFLTSEEFNHFFI